MTAEPALVGEIAAALGRDGFTFPHDALTPAESGRTLLAFREYDATMARAGGMHSAFRRFPKIHLAAAWADELVRHPRILDAVGALLGPDLLVWSTNAFVRERHSPDMLAWHQDALHYDLRGFESGAVRVWLALTDTTEANGTLRFARGSHREGIVAHRTDADSEQIRASGLEVDIEIDESCVVPVLLRAGQFSIHHMAVAHASGSNHTGTARVNVAIDYLAPSVAPAGDSDTAIAGPRQRPVRALRARAAARVRYGGGNRAMEAVGRRAAAPPGYPVSNDVAGAPVDHHCGLQVVDLGGWLRGPVIDQGLIPLCTASVTTSLAQYWAARDGGITFVPSVLFNYRLSRRLAGRPDRRGSTLAHAFAAWRRFGLLDEEHWPLRPDRIDIDPPPELIAAADFRDVAYERLDDTSSGPADLLDTVRRRVAGGAPVTAEFPLGPSLVGSLWTGIIDLPPDGERAMGRHVVLVLGYDDNLPTRSGPPGALRFRNNWGAGWGAGGHGWLPYELLRRGIAREFWTVRLSPWSAAGHESRPETAQARNPKGKP